jgi:hypothetical protein
VDINPVNTTFGTCPPAAVVGMPWGPGLLHGACSEDSVERRTGVQSTPVFAESRYRGVGQLIRWVAGRAVETDTSSPARWERAADIRLRAARGCEQVPVETNK